MVTLSSDEEDLIVEDRHRSRSGARQRGSRDRGRRSGSAESAAENPGSKAERMMQKMGYVPGTGLGKAGQGRLEPVSFVVIIRIS